MKLQKDINAVEPNTIILGDTLESLKSLPDDHFDVGVTSPPYNKGERHKGWLVKNVIYDNASDKKDENTYQEEQTAVLNELHRVIKPGGSFFYNHKLRWERGWMIHPYTWVVKSNWAVRQEIIWNRGIAGNIRGWRFWQIEERLYWLYKPLEGKEKEPIGRELASRHAKMTSVWNMRPESKFDWAPNPFPLALPARCILSIMNGTKGRVIDPYSGSGTTLVAAKLLEQEYLGIDISEDYRRRALERIDNSYLEEEVLNKEVSLHQIKSNFKEYKAKVWSKPRNNKQKKML